MLIVQVAIRVKPECVADFIAATVENARNSAREKGIARFDFMRDGDDPNRFLLFEVYRDKDAPAAHRETAHYQKWRTAVESMMAEARVRKEYQNVFPDDAGW